MEIEVIPLESDLEKEEIINLSKIHNFQVFDLNSVNNEFQIKLGYLHAKNAFEEKRNISRDFMLEWLIRVAGVRQIQKAIKKVGIKNPKSIIVSFEEGKFDENKLKSLLKAKKIIWKQKNDEKSIMKMVELELE